MSDDAGLEVDLVVLSRTAEPLRTAFQQGIAAQSRAGVTPRLVRVIGAPRPDGDASMADNRASAERGIRSERRPLGHVFG